MKISADQWFVKHSHQTNSYTHLKTLMFSPFLYSDAHFEFPQILLTSSLPEAENSQLIEPLFVLTSNWIGVTNKVAYKF